MLENPEKLENTDIGATYEICMSKIYHRLTIYRTTQYLEVAVKTNDPTSQDKQLYAYYGGFRICDFF